MKPEAKTKDKVKPEAKTKDKVTGEKSPAHSKHMDIINRANRRSMI